MRRILAAAMLLVLCAASGALALSPFYSENMSTVADGKAAPFVGDWSVQIHTRNVSTVATCEHPFRIVATGTASIRYKAPKDPEAAVDLIAEDRRTTWKSNVPGGGFLAVWIDENSFYLYDEESPDFGGPYLVRRCPLGRGV